MTKPPHTAATINAESGEAVPSAPRDRLKNAIDHVAELLPAQGPIRVFVHHNTLHAFEDLPFDDGVRVGAETFGCEPYLPEANYRQKYEKGRIRVEDLTAVLQDELGPRAAEPILGFGNRFEIRLAMLRHPLRQATGDELRWLMAETDALLRFRGEAPFAVQRRTVLETRHWIQRIVVDPRSGSTAEHSQEIAGVIAELLREHPGSAPDRWTDGQWEAFTLELLWRICRHGIHAVHEPRQKPRSPLNHRDAVLQATGHDSDLLVNDLLIRFCASFLDQGFSAWPLPRREQGFAAAFAGIYGGGQLQPERWRAGFAEQFARIESPEFDPLSSIAESLERLGVVETEWTASLTTTLLALRGWAGMIRQIESRGDRVARPIPAGSLMEFLAVRLLLECAALEYLAREHLNYRGPLSGLKKACQPRQPKPSDNRLDQRAFVMFQLAQLLGWLPKDLLSLNRENWATLIHEVESFGDLERRRIYHLAFERAYRIQVLDALSFCSQRERRPAVTPLYQVVCCLDEREESFRRHLEEVSPETQTFSAAGFFNIPIYYRGVADAHFVPLCPIVIRPQHWVSEDAKAGDDDKNAMRSSARKLFGHTVHQLQQRSQTGMGGALIAAGLGALATFPLVARVLFPRLAARLRSSAGLWVLPRNTELKLRRNAPQPSANGEGIGFTVEELATCGERVLRDMGLTEGFASLVLIVGHGSTSLNNPHKSAYDCGACGGGSGGPNARAMAE